MARLTKNNSSLWGSNPPSPSDRNKQKFYEYYRAGLLDESKITNDGWKNLYEHELEKGYASASDIPRDAVSKYGIDTSVGRSNFSEPIDASLNTPDIDPMLETKEKESVFSKLSSFFGGIGKDNVPKYKQDFDTNTLPKPSTNLGDLLPKKPTVDTEFNSSAWNSVIEQKNQGLGLKPNFGNKSLVENDDPLLMALNSKIDPKFIGEHTKQVMNTINTNRFNKQMQEQAQLDQFGARNPYLPDGSINPNGSIAIPQDRPRVDSANQPFLSDGTLNPAGSIFESGAGDNNLKAGLHGAYREFIGRNAQLNTDKIIGQTSSALDRGVNQDMAQKVSNQRTEDREYWTEDRMFNAFLGKPHDAEITTSESVSRNIGGFAGNLGKMLLFSQVLGPATTTKGMIAKNAGLGALSRAESSYSMGEDSETIVKDALIGAGSFAIGELAGIGVTNKLTNQLIHTFKTQPQWANHLTALVRSARGITDGTVGTLSEIALSNVMGKETEIGLKDAVQSGLIMGIVNGVTSYIPWGRLNVSEQEMKSFNIKVDEVDGEFLKTNGYIKLSDIDGVNTNNPYINDIYINPNTKDIVVSATRDGAFLVPTSMVQDTLDSQTIDIINRIQDTPIRQDVDFKTQPDYIDKVSDPNKYAKILNQFMENEGYKLQSMDGQQVYAKYNQLNTVEGDWDIVPIAKAEQKFDSEYFTRYKNTQGPRVEAGPRTEQATIGRFDDSYEVNRAAMDTTGKQWVRDMQDKGYSEYKPGVWVKEVDGNIVDIVPEFTVGKGGKAIPVFDIKDGETNTSRIGVKGFAGGEYDIDKGATKPVNEYMGNSDQLTSAVKDAKDIDTKTYDDFMANMKELGITGENVKGVADADFVKANKRIEEFLNKKSVREIFATIRNINMEDDADSTEKVHEFMGKFNNEYNQFFFQEGIASEAPKVKSATRPIEETKVDDVVNTEDSTNIQDEIETTVNNGDIVNYDGHNYVVDKVDGDKIEIIGADPNYSEKLTVNANEVNAGKLIKEYKEGDKVQFTSPDGEILSGTIRYIDEDEGEATIKVDQSVITPDGVPIGRVEYVKLEDIQNVDLNEAPQSSTNDLNSESEEMVEGGSETLLEGQGATTKAGNIQVGNTIDYQSGDKVNSGVIVRIDEDRIFIKNNIDDFVTKDIHKDSIVGIRSGEVTESPTMDLEEEDNQTLGDNIKSDTASPQEVEEVLKDYTDAEKYSIGEFAQKMTTDREKDLDRKLTDDEITKQFDISVSVAKQLVDAINNKDFDMLTGRLNRQNSNSLKLFSDLTGLSTRTQKVTVESIRSLDPESYDNWKISKADEAKTQKDLEKQEEKEAKEKEKQEELEEISKNKVRTTKGLTTIGELVESSFTEGYRLVKTNDYGGYEWTNPTTDDNLNYKGLSKDNKRYVREKYEEFEEKAIADDEAREQTEYDAMNDEEKSKYDADIAHLFGEDKVPGKNAEDISEDIKINSKGEYNIVRIGNEDANLKPSTIPQGLYVSIPDDVDNFNSPHDSGNVKYIGTAKPKNTLVVTDTKIEHARFGASKEGYGSAGVVALKTLVGDNEFNRLIKLNKIEMINLLNKEYPKHDYTRYYDSYELLEAYAGLLARDKGYDSILLEDKEFPELSELVVLKDDIMKIMQTKIIGEGQASSKTQEQSESTNNPTGQEENKSPLEEHTEATESIVETSSTSKVEKEDTEQNKGINETNTNHKPSQAIADYVKGNLKNGVKFTSKDLFKVADEAYGGTQANGVYSVKDAFDSMELAINQYLLEQSEINLRTNDINEVKENLSKIVELLDLIPTQYNRNQEVLEYQQFSTPPNIAYISGWVANMNSDDVMLEPSAGIGGLALFAKAKGAKAVVNELSERRLDILKNMPFDGFFNENAEQIDNILPAEIKPTVVVMNPPFSATAGRVSANKTKYATLHIEQALSRLEDGGRLVAIVGNTMGEDFKQFTSWWNDLKKKYDVKANITIDGQNYKKYGTTYSVNLVIIDKTGPTTTSTVIGKFDGLMDVIDKLEGIRDERRLLQEDSGTQSTSSESTSTQDVESGESRDDNDRTISNTNDRMGVGGVRTQAIVQEPTGTTDSVLSETESSIDNETTGGRTGSVTRPRGNVGDDDNNRAGGVSSRDNKTRTVFGNSELEVSVKTDTKKVDVEDIDKIFSDYTPQKLDIKGSKAHKGKLSESAAMGAVEPPNPTYVPNLPIKIIESGDLSDAQLEAVVYAGQSHEQTLPNGNRRGFFIGDGTGVGKGREIAGIILDNYNQGRKKAIWVSKNKDLFGDAQRDASGVGMDSKTLFQMPKVGAKIEKEEGVLFIPYGTLRSNLNHSAYHQSNKDKNVTEVKARIDQIINWVGKDFDGVIAFDEAHEMANALPQKGKRGKVDASQASLAGQLIQEALPNARVVYVSATGASEVHNLAYLSRLGLWGEGTPFASVNHFIDSIGKGGMASMELVARDMKAQGVYLSRSLSYDGVTYDRLEHELTDIQRESYDTFAEAWQIVLQNMGEALEITGAGNRERGAAQSRFWGSQQRFFNQILTSMAMPSVLDSIRENIDNDMTAVIQITNTNEAMQERKITDAMENDIDLEDIDMSPRDMLIQYLQNAFPVNQFEDYEDENGNIKTRPVIDSQGNKVVNKQAVESRDKLIAMVGSINMPDSPLDMIINTFGTENVAEITGRKRRIVRTKDEATGIEKAKIEKRGDSAKNKDVDDFANDKKRILIFSQAGGTGKSYHASLDYKNQHRRVHYVLQAGFSAMSAMQGLGRTHRTNQASAPHVALVTTDLAGHKRFISTIARRLDQLGALTKGQRQAGTQGLFGEKDNLEGPIAKDSLRVFYQKLGRGSIIGLDKEVVLTKMGLRDYLLDERGNMISESDIYTDVNKFLNRLLVLDAELQNNVFNAYSEILDEAVERAIENGTLDVGLENFKADEVLVNEEIVVRTDEETGAETKYVSFDVKDKTKVVEFDDLQINSNSFKGFYRNTRSGMVRAYFTSRSVTNEDGSIEQTYRSYEPEQGKIQRINDKDLSKETLEKITVKEARVAWDKQLKELPEYKENQLHLMTGVLLPIWDRLDIGDARARILRVITTDGKEYLGRFIKEDYLDTILGRLGKTAKKKEYEGQDVLDKIVKNNYTAFLSNGWKIKRSRVAGDYRIELIGPDYSRLKSLENIGVFTEVIGYKTRFFIPGTEGVKIIDNLTKSYPISRMVRESDTKSSIPTTINNQDAGPRRERPKKIKPISEIIKGIEQDFRISVSSKRYRGGRGAIGQYQTHSESIRVKTDNNIQTIAHELGHHFDKKYNLSTRYSSYIKTMEEGLSLSDDYKLEEIPGEVIAEFIRLYLVTENKAYELSPDFYNAFMETLDSKELKNLNKHREDILNWYASDLMERGQSTIRSHTEKRKTSTKNKLTNLEMFVFDDLAPIRMFSETVEEYTGQKLSFNQHPYVLAMQSRRSGMVAKAQIIYAQTDPEGNIIGDSFKELLKDISKDKMRAFDDYLKVSHAITLHEYGKQVYSDDFTIEDMQLMKVSYELDNPQFADIAQGVYEWWNRFVEEWVVKQGFLAPEVWADLKEKYPTYVPNFRYIGEENYGSQARRGFGNQNSPIKRMKGSAKDTYSVIESLLIYTDKIVKTQKRNEVGLAVHDLYLQVEGLGDTLTKITHENQLNKYNAQDLKISLTTQLITDYIDQLTGADKDKANKLADNGEYEELMEFLTSKGFAGAEIVDNTIDDIITFFTPRMFSTDRGVYTVIDKAGKTHFYEVHDPLFLEAMLNLSDKSMDKVTRLIGAWKRMFTNLTTGANPIFGVTSNIWGDVPQAFIYGNYKNPLEFGVDLAKSMKDIFTGNEKAEAYYAMGGGMSSPISENRQLMTEMLNKLFPDMKKSGVKSMVDYMIGQIEQFNDTIESAPRLTEFTKVMEEHGDSYEGRLRAIYEASELTTNFLRHGRMQYTIIGQGVPFLNAGLQGMYKLHQEYINRRGAGRNDLTGDGGRKKDNKRLAGIMLKALLSITIFEILQMIAYQDDEEYNKLAEYLKDGYWLIKYDDGKFIRIKKPRAEGMIFGSMFRRGFKQGIGDKAAWEGFADTFVNTFLPPNPATDNIFAAVIGVGRNKTWSGNPIVPVRLQNLPPLEQYDISTSSISKAVSQVLNKATGIETSPKNIDYLIQQYTGIIGQVLLPATTETTTVGGAIARKMTTDLAFSNSVVNEFYDNKEKLDAAYTLYNQKGTKSKDFDPVQRYRYNQISSDMSDLWKEINSIKEDTVLSLEEKQTKERALRLELMKLADPENLKPTSYDEFKVLYNRGQDMTSKYKEQYENTKVRPEYTKEEQILLQLYNVKVDGQRSQLGAVNYQLTQINKRRKQVEGTNTLTEANKKKALQKLDDSQKQIVDKYMEFYRTKYNIDIDKYF